MPGSRLHGVGGGVGGVGLDRKQAPFAIKSAAVANQAAVLANDAVTRDDDGNGVHSVCGSDCACRPRPPDGHGDVGVGRGASERSVPCPAADDATAGGRPQSTPGRYRVLLENRPRISPELWRPAVASRDGRAGQAGKSRSNTQRRLPRSLCRRRSRTQCAPSPRGPGCSCSSDHHPPYCSPYWIILQSSHHRGRHGTALVLCYN